MSKIDDALKSNESREFENKDRDHAKALVMKLLGSARHEVIIFCHRLAQDVYGSEEVCNALNEAYRNNPNLKVQVYIRDEVPEFSPFVSTLIDRGVRIHSNIKNEETGDILLVDGQSGREEKSEKEREGRAYIHNDVWAKKARKKLHDLTSAA